jgi:hypothetical protein
MLDRLLAATVFGVVVAAVLPRVLPPVTAAIVVGTVCFVVVRAVLYFTGRW